MNASCWEKQVLKMKGSERNQQCFDRAAGAKVSTRGINTLRAYEINKYHIYIEVPD